MYSSKNEDEIKIKISKGNSFYHLATFSPDTFTLTEVKSIFFFERALFSAVHEDGCPNSDLDADGLRVNLTCRKKKKKRVGCE